MINYVHIQKIGVAVEKCPNSHQIFVTIDEWVYWLLALVSPSAFAMAFDRLMVFENLNLPIDLWASMGSMPLGGMLIMLAVGNKMGYENAFEVHKAQNAKKCDFRHHIVWLTRLLSRQRDAHGVRDGEEAVVLPRPGILV